MYQETKEGLADSITTFEKEIESKEEVKNIEEARRILDLANTAVLYFDELSQEEIDAVINMLIIGERSVLHDDAGVFDKSLELTNQIENIFKTKGYILSDKTM